MSKPELTVVWSGRDELLPDRPESWDSRFAAMPDFDLDVEDVVIVPVKRKYNKTGKHKGKFSRTNPAAKNGYIAADKRTTMQMRTPWLNREDEQ